MTAREDAIKEDSTATAREYTTREEDARKDARKDTRKDTRQEDAREEDTREDLQLPYRPILYVLYVYKLVEVLIFAANSIKNYAI